MQRASNSRRVLLTRQSTITDGSPSQIAPRKHGGRQDDRSQSRKPVAWKDPQQREILVGAIREELPPLRRFLRGCAGEDAHEVREERVKEVARRAVGRLHQERRGTIIPIDSSDLKPLCGFLRAAILVFRAEFKVSGFMCDRRVEDSGQRSLRVHRLGVVSGLGCRWCAGQAFGARAPARLRFRLSDRLLRRLRPRNPARRESFRLSGLPS
jgi:hypothetical protein